MIPLNRLLDAATGLVDLGPALAAIGTTEDASWPLGTLHHALPGPAGLCIDNLCSRCVMLGFEWRTPRRLEEHA